MAQRIDFMGDFRAEALSVLSPASWYLGFACTRCKLHFAILNDPTNTGDLEISGNASFEATCPNCGETTTYLVADLAPFQAAQGGPVSTGSP